MTSGLTTFTLLHVVISLVGIISGLVVAGGLVAGKRLDGWTGVFLLTTAATSITGFGFPFVTFLPSHAVAILSLAVLPVVIVARYVKPPVQHRVMPVDATPAHAAAPDDADLSD